MRYSFKYHGHFENDKDNIVGPYDLFLKHLGDEAIFTLIFYNILQLFWWSYIHQYLRKQLIICFLTYGRSHSHTS